ncbi:MAG: ThuA domain-containing protein [Sedimentisphaerales bacterium]|nr:ThuA domain-containing protein [Sedimentisphaerales bacterium]
MRLKLRTFRHCLLGAMSALGWTCFMPQGASAAQVETRKVVVVTGIDYPGHKWQETAPVLAEAIRKDPRLKVDVVETPAFLGTAKLNDCDVVVLHFMNWESPDPGEQARQNLASFVNNGGGLVLVHFACGAFQGWGEFVKLAGRVYDPKLRPHDPYGPFQVVRTDLDHPITRGMQPFQTTDELYTCLAPSRTPIEIIATARSRVDGKDYPMGFVLNYGKGRVFHSVLGHDAQSLANPPVAQLFRRACAWCANLLPEPQATDAKSRKIAFLAGKPSHGEDIHGWEENAEFIRQRLLNASNVKPVQIDVYTDGWPKDSAALDDVDAIIFFADGRDLHPLKEPDRAARIRELAKQGKGLAFLHYSIDPPEGLQEDMRRWMGGCYQVGLSQNPINTVKVTPVENGHPISRGCHGYVAEDEWYFDIGFRPNDPNIVPIMTGKLPPRNPQDKVLAWAYTRADGGRGFGFTGGHPDSNWHMEPFRKLVLNAILWVAKAEVPEGGAASVQPWRFVSIPNFASADANCPEETLDYVLKAIKAEDPEFVLVPGDLIAGNWPDKESIEEQAAVCYRAWVKRMQDHGLRFYAAVGDRDIGGSPWTAEKANLVRIFKRQFQKHLAMPLSGPLRMKGTAFWFVYENALFVALDVFEKGAGDQAGIVPQVTGEQLQWLEQTLTDNPGVEHVIVMAHTPVIRMSSAGLTLAGGTESSLWQALKKHRAQLYLCGEVPAIRCTQADGILQIAHGATISRDPRLNYLVATVSDKGIELELKEIAVTNDGGRTTISDEAKKQGFVTAGKATLDDGSAMKDATGCLLSAKEAKP